jgi:hypothetical protein
MLTPATYMSRYLPVSVPDGLTSVPVYVRRYRLYNFAAAKVMPPEQQRLLGLAADLVRHKTAKGGPGLTLTVNGSAVLVTEIRHIGTAIARPFLGKGSPEDCQVVLQLAMLLGVAPAARLQDWADTTIGLDCNGFAGNYLFRVWKGRSWPALDGDADPGPSRQINKLFDAVAGPGHRGMVSDIDEIDPAKTYIVVRTDRAGHVMPGPVPVGHVALTQPGQAQMSYISMDLRRKDDDIMGKFALRTVESAGPVDGVGQNWLIFRKQLQDGLFEVTRDRILKIDTVRLAPLF